MKKCIVLFIVIIEFSITNAQYYACDSIFEDEITDIAIDNNLLFYSTKKGYLKKYDLNLKQIISTTSTPNPITKIFINNDNYFFTTGNIISIVNKTSLDEYRIIDSKTISNFVVNNDNIYYGGKSGVLLKYNRSKNSTSELFNTKQKDKVYWITDIKFIRELNWLVVCAGDLYIYSIKENRIIKRIEDIHKNYFTCNFYNESVIASNYRKNEIIKINKNLTTEVFYNHFSYLLEFLDADNIAMSPNNQFIIYNKSKNKEEIIEKGKTALNFLNLNDSIIVNYGNKIVFYEKRLTPFIKPVILRNINFNVGKITFKDSIKARNGLQKVLNEYILLKDSIFLIRIFGHTDGDNEKLYALSIKRANKIKNELVAQGIPANSISTTGYGGKKPITNKVNERWKNRRVEFMFISNNEILSYKARILAHVHNKKLIIINNKDRIVIDKKLDIIIIKSEHNLVFFKLNLWIINKHNNITYSELDNTEITTLRETNLRLKPNFDANVVLFKSKKGAKYELEDISQDKENNIWYKFSLYGYYEK